MLVCLAKLGRKGRRGYHTRRDHAQHAQLCCQWQDGAVVLVWRVILLPTALGEDTMQLHTVHIIRHMTWALGCADLPESETTPSPLRSP